MRYRVFHSSRPQMQLAEVGDSGRREIKLNDKIPLTLNGRDIVYIVDLVGGVARDTCQELILDLWVKGPLPESS